MSDLKKSWVNVWERKNNDHDWVRFERWLGGFWDKDTSGSPTNWPKTYSSVNLMPYKKRKVFTLWKTQNSRKKWAETTIFHSTKVLKNMNRQPLPTQGNNPKMRKYLKKLPTPFTNDFSELRIRNDGDYFEQLPKIYQ